MSRDLYNRPIVNELELTKVYHLCYHSLAMRQSDRKGESQRDVDPRMIPGIPASPEDLARALFAPALRKRQEFLKRQAREKAAQAKD